MNVLNKFKKFGGEKIPNIIEYLKNFINAHPYVTISVGCDSIQGKRKTSYSCTITLRDNTLMNGCHIVFFIENISKITNDYDRLKVEFDYVSAVSEFLDAELKSFYVRKDLTDFERKKYKYHLLKCGGSDINPDQEDKYIRHMSLTNYESEMEYKLVDIHLDYSYRDFKSDISYKSFVPGLRAMGYRVFVKPYSYGSSRAADKTLKKRNKNKNKIKNTQLP